MPEPHYPPGHDPADLDNTQPTQPPTTPMPPLRGDPGMALPPRHRGKDARRKNDERATTFYPGNQDKPKPPRGHRRDRSESGLYLPAWSVILMLVIVLSVAGGIILLVVTLGGNPAAPGKPRVIIVTAIPSPTGPSVATDVTLAAGQSADAGALQLEGPLLPTVAISPTPVEIAVGKVVRVINVADHGLNVRQGPGTANTSNFIAHEGDTFVIVAGPQASENFTWWQLQSNVDPSKAGWAVSNDGEQDTLEVAVQ